MTETLKPIPHAEDQPSQRRPAPISGPHDVPAPNAPHMIREVSFTLNGRPVHKAIDVRASLTDLLRNDFRMTSVKKGCEVGECGACTVLINGEAIDSCIYLAVWADGKDVVTTEGLAAEDGSLHIVQQAFVDATAVQCGFCTPGILMTAKELVDTGHVYSREELRVELSGHLCRCTGYENILNGLELAIQRDQTRRADGHSNKFADIVEGI